MILLGFFELREGGAPRCSALCHAAETGGEDLAEACAGCEDPCLTLRTLQQLGASDFGSRLRGAFEMPSAPILSARDLRFGSILVTELRCDGENYGRSQPIPEQDAILVSLQFRQSLNHVVWEDGKQLQTVPL